jgi:hypothetical protein
MGCQNGFSGCLPFAVLAALTTFQRLLPNPQPKTIPTCKDETPLNANCNGHHSNGHTGEVPVGGHNRVAALFNEHAGNLEKENFQDTLFAVGANGDD